MTRRGAEVAVLVPADEWRRLSAAAQPSLKELLLSSPGRTETLVPVLHWIRDIPDVDLNISAVTVGEIQAGIELTCEQDAAKAAELEQWLELVSRSFNVLAMDAQAGIQARRLRKGQGL